MYNILSDLLSDKKGGAVFNCFGLWHIIYMCIIFVIIFFIATFLKNKNNGTKSRIITNTVNCAFALYISDFFLMPFAYGEIDLEKLPFHMCTAMCVMCFISRHLPALERHKQTFAMLGLISNVIYVIYPAGLGWHSVHHFSYRVIQTILFHGIMTAYGILVLIYESNSSTKKSLQNDLYATVFMTLWALLGNTFYNGSHGEYSHFFNWFFVVRDPFYILPESIARYVMPFIMVFVIMLADVLLRTVFIFSKSIIKHLRADISRT